MKEFNAIAAPEAKTYMAIGRYVPVVGENYICKKIINRNGDVRTVDWRTSTVKEVLDIGNHIYYVVTCNSLYIVSVDR